MAMYVISDIHGYLDALRSSLAVPIAINNAAKENPKIEPIDLILVLGDIIGYGPEQMECIELLRKQEVAWYGANPDKAKEEWTPSNPIATDIASQESIISEIARQASPDLVDTKYEPIRLIVLAANHGKGVMKHIEDGHKLKVGGNFSKRAAPTLESELERAFEDYLRTDRGVWAKLIEDQSTGEEGIDARVAELVFSNYAGTVLRGFNQEVAGKEGGGIITTQSFATYGKQAVIELMKRGHLREMDQDYHDRLRGVQAFGWLRRVVERGKTNGYKEILHGPKYDILACHSHPLRTETDDYADNLNEIALNLPEGIGIAFCGHTHILGWNDNIADCGKMVINPGSIGDPRKNPQTQAILPATAVICYPYLDPGYGVIPLQKDYDYKSTIKKLEQRGMHVTDELKELMKLAE